MVLNGIFTGSQAEIDWLDKGQFRTFYPEVWEGYLASTPSSHHKDPGAYHYEKIIGDDAVKARSSGLAYDTLEVGVMSLNDSYTDGDPETYDPTGVRLEMYFMHNGCFMPDRYIFENATKLTMPVWLVQGRYDMVCPPNTAHELSQKLPNSKLVWTISGHAGEHETQSVIRTALLCLTS